MRRTVRRLGVALVALALLAPAAAAQIPRRGDADREQLEERVRARMAEMIRERLELTREEGERLEEVMADFHLQRRALRMEERALRQRLGRWSRGAGAGSDEAGAILDRMVELREAEVRLFQAEQERLLEILTPEQVLTLHALRDRMGQRLRELRGGPGGPPGPRGPGGHPSG